MTVLRTVPQITSLLVRGLGDVSLPFAGEVGSDMGLYVIKQIDGLDPPDQTLAIAKTASGGKYQGKESAAREIVALISLSPGEDPKTLRNNLHTMLNTGYNPKVTIFLMAGLAVVGTVDAYVTRFQSAMFVKDPVVQITFEMLNDKFKAPAARSYPASVLSETYPDIYNDGTAESGFQFAVKFTDDMAHWYLRVAEDDSIGMTFDKAFNTGDILTVSTIPGQRYVHWNKAGGTVQNKMGILRDDSEWIAIHPGHNHFKVPPGTTKWQWHGPLTFTPQFWGV